MLFLQAGSGYFSDRRQYVRLFLGMIVEEEGTRACQCCMILLVCFFLHDFAAMLFCYSGTLWHEQLFSQRIIETITKVVNHLSAASSIIVSFLIRTELAITVKIWSNVLRPEISIFHLNGSESAEEHLLEPLPGYITLLTRGYVHCARRLSSFEQDIKNISAQRELVTTSERDIKAFFWMITTCRTATKQS